jgi:hypothetical protein
MANGHGGKRRRHEAPALNMEQVMKLRELRSERVPYKTLESLFGVSRHTLWKAVVGKGAYPR